jgi:hypothetical protein
MDTKSPEKETKQEVPHQNIQAPQSISQQPSPHEAFARATSIPASALTPDYVMALQRVVGNQAVQRLLVESDGGGAQKDEGRANAPAAPLAEKTQTARQETHTGQLLVVEEDFEPAEFAEVPDEFMEVAHHDTGERHTGRKPAVAAPQAEFHDLGRTGTARFGDAQVLDDSYPHAFTHRGKTGTVVWGGGGGAGSRGNEPAGSVQVNVKPVYEASPVTGGTSEARVRARTGRLDVIRSWVGVNGGDQGNGYYLTPGAAARFDRHELLHVGNSRTHYSHHIDPLLTRVGERRSAATQADAIAALRTFINWRRSVTAFQHADNADNRPMGRVDNNDLASGTYPIDVGAGTVGGTAFTHRVRLPSEPNPT